MKTLEQLKADHAKEIAALEREQSLRTFLPVEPKLICQHKEYTTIQYAKARFPERYSLADAIAIMEQFQPIEVEHWKDGCVSVLPREINYTEKKEKAVLDGTSIVEVKIAAGRGYDSHALIFWAKAGDQWLKVEIEITPPWKWMPEVKFTYNQDGECCTNYVRPKSVREDIRRKWWSPGGSYQLSYYWAEIASFKSIAELDANK